jgi:hypothetical protein
MKDELSYLALEPFSSFLLHPSALLFGAGDEIRTRDPQLGRLMLYQLSYTRPQISDFEFRIANLKGCCCARSLNPKFAIRNPKFFLVQGVGFEPT